MLLIPINTYCVTTGKPGKNGERSLQSSCQMISYLTLRCALIVCLCVLLPLDLLDECDPHGLWSDA